MVSMSAAFMVLDQRLNVDNRFNLKGVVDFINLGFALIAINNIYIPKQDVEHSSTFKKFLK